MLPSHLIKKHIKASSNVPTDSDLSPPPATAMPNDAKEALTASETRWKFALEASGDGVWDWNPITDEAFFSEQLLKILGYEGGKFVDNMSDCTSMIHPEELIYSQPAVMNHLKGKTESYWCEHRMKHKQGHWIWLLSRGLVVSRNEDGIADRMVGTVTDITKQKEAEALVWRQANIDMLTGLPNRRLFHAQLKQAITDCRLQSKGCVALMLLDLDNFKTINDTHGHQYGDLLLEEAAKRLSTCVGENDLAARLGGDEFTVILKSIAEKSDITAVANHILEVLAKPFVINKGTFHVSASIGITCYPHDASDIDELIMNADQAMYNSKYLGRNCYSYFSYDMRTAAQQRMHSINELHKAFKEEQFEVYYQPIINFKTGLIVKAECLLRWNHPTRKLLGADHIIPLAEETGLIVEIGNWIFKKSITQLAHWRKAYAPTLQISINTSPVQYQHDECVVSEWYEFMDQLGLPYNCLVVEITENITLDLNSKVNGKLEAFRNGGVQLALDDFGTGYSSLSYLKELDSHYLKIDRSFVNNIVESKKSRALCLEIIKFAQIFDMKIVAEGIETQNQAELLSTGGCDFGQGYLYSRPLPADQFETLLKKQPFHQKTPVINESIAVPVPLG